jgi:hypothetical protein
LEGSSASLKRSVLFADLTTNATQAAVSHGRPIAGSFLRNAAMHDAHRAVAGGGEVIDAVSELYFGLDMCGIV